MGLAKIELSVKDLVKTIQLQITKMQKAGQKTGGLSLRSSGEP